MIDWASACHRRLSEDFQVGAKKNKEETMIRERILLLTILILMLTALACNAFAGTVEPALPLPQTTAVATIAADGPAPVSTATLPGDATTAAGATVTVLVDLNVRSGPGVAYDRVGFLLAGASMPIQGRSAEGDWWQIACPEDIGGTACWVSAGEQFSRATNASEVAVVEIPPTPTPRPPDLAENTAVLAYVDGGRLFVTLLDLTANPPTADAPRQLVEEATVQRIALSPDGRRVAFVAGTFRANSLNVVSVDGSGLQTLIASEAMAREGDAGRGVVVLVDQIAWQPDGLGLAFTTAEASLVGPGFGSQQDLWAVDLDGTAVELLPPPQGGGGLAFLSDGRLLVSAQGQILRVEPAGATRETLIRFAPINTASEYIYFPQVQVTQGDTTLVAIPDSDPWQPDSGAALWQIPAVGPAVEMGALAGNILFSPVIWSDDGARLGYVQQLMDLTNPVPQLVIAEGSGQNPAVVDASPQLRFFGWNTAGDALLYASQGFLTLARPDADPLLFGLAQGQLVDAARWITADSFVAAVGFPDNNTWELRAGTTAGSETLLATLSSGTSGVTFDVWP